MGLSSWHGRMRRKKMNIIQITEQNIDTEHICCAIGNDKVNKARAETKKAWMKREFKNGLVFKRLDDRGKMFIEYMPVEKCWKPVEGQNYTMINCLWVSGKFKKQGIANELLQGCVDDSKEQGKAGICVVTSKKNKPFLTEKKFFERMGFEVIDSAQPYFELMALKFDSDAPLPTFTEACREGKQAYKDGFLFVYSNQCPFMEEYVHLLADICEKREIKNKIIKINSSEDAKKYGSPFGTFGLYHKGEFINHELMSENKFLKLLDTMV
jgi:ribosomal protein S18 acetylase RimI-like enzyme